MKGLIIALSMYTKIPVPNVTWDNKSMRHVYLYFPLIGVIIGSAIYAWFKICTTLDLTGFLFAVGAVALPIVITGGIHMDGFLDTVDAISSFGDKEKRLAILKDPHVGAFGVIMCGVYLLIQAGLWSQVYADPHLFNFAILSFIFSRALSALAAVCFPLAKNSGLAQIFADGASKKPVILVSALYLCVLIILMALINIKATIIFLPLILVLFLWHRKMSLKTFGGITGDLIGYLLQLTELLILALVAFFPN